MILPKVGEIMVAGYGNNKAEVLEFIESNGYELKQYFEPSGDTVKDMTAISLWLRKHKDVNVVTIYDMDEAGGEAAYNYWLWVFLCKGVDILSVSSDEDFEFGFKLRQMSRYRASILRKRVGDAVSISKRAKDKSVYARYRLPYGYVWNRYGEIVIDKEQAHHVKYVYAKRKEGMALREVARRMNEYGWRTENGGKFTRDKINSWIFHNKMFYYGYQRDIDGNFVKGSYEPIIPEGFLEDSKIVIDDPKLRGLE